MKQLQNPKTVYFLLLVLVFLFYGNSIQNNYSLDDHLVNKNNELIQKGLRGIPEIFQNYSFNEKGLSYSYRPVLLTSFAIEYTFFGANPHVSHFISLLLYAGFVILLFRFLQLLFPNVDYWIKLVTVILFVVFPLHTEVVDNIKCRDELLVALFGISILINLQSYFTDKKNYRIFLIAFFTIMGRLTKESVLIYLVVALFLLLNYFLCHKKKNWTSIAFIFVSLLIGFFCAGIIKHVFSVDNTPSRGLLFYENPLINFSFYERIPAGLGIISFNLKLLIWPFNPLYYYGYNQIDIANWSGFLPYLSLLILSGVLFLIVRFFRKNFFLAFGAIILLINLLAVANIYSLLPGIAGERFLFWGSLGYLMIFVFLLFTFFEKLNWIKKTVTGFSLSKQAILLIAIFVFAFGIKVFSRNKAWKDEFTIVSTDAVRLSKSAKAQDLFTFQLMGKIKTEQNYYQRISLINQAVFHCSLCLSIYPDYITCWNNLGTLYFAKKEFVLAEASFKKALQVDSTDANPLFNLGNIYQEQSKRGPALLFYERALKNNPDIKDLIPVYKQFCLKNNCVKEGILFVNQILIRHPKNYNLYLLQADFFNAERDYENMLPVLQKANEIKPDEKIVGYIKNITNFINANPKKP